MLQRDNKLRNKFHHENWPMSVFYAPVFLYYLYNSLKLRKLNYFTVVNPALKTGGLCGFSKFKSFKLLPGKMIPKTIILKDDIYSESQIADMIAEANLSFPLVVKPDQGERGFLVSKVDSLRELTEAIGNKTLKFDFLIQEYIEGPLELGIFLLRKSDLWTISSMTSKNFLTVVGNGKSSISELIEDDLRGKKYFDSFKKIDLNRIPIENENILLEPIGNHCRGTEFVDECCKITDEINMVFSDLLSNVKGINYCRLDLRTESWSDLLQGDFKVMEINGVSAEPAHIYDPKVGLGQAYKDLFTHWSEMASIAKEQIAQGESSEKLSDTVNLVRTHMRRKKEFLKVKESVVDVMGCKALDFTSNPIDILNKFSIEGLLTNHKCSKAKEGYERTILYKNREFEVVFCHWRSSDKSPVHLHPDLMCWFKCIKGELLEIHSMGQEQKIIKSGEIGYIEDSMGAHQMLNISDDCAYSIHIYQNMKEKT